ncbi:MAG TPA: alpha-amylase family glycosyl hydrolase [Bryobacteraceae bacterium]|nr:alpha-amylase family glycosyl hydrolase [Bryobacteraceae bacterium]
MKAVLFVFGSLVSTAAVPVVSRVEPPDWPVPAHATTLRLLFTGHDLGGASVRPCKADFKTGSVSVSAGGTHLFVDLTIPSGARIGACALQVATAGGSATAPFEIVPALPAAGRFQGFSTNDVIYLIMPDRFANGDPSNDDPAGSRGLLDRSKARFYHGGDFAGIRRRLPYLKDLGVTAIWLTPIYDNVNHLNERERYDNQAITDYHGYGAVDFYGVDEHLGTLESFRELVDEAHRLGIKVIQDEVANHTGPYHPWVQDSPTQSWFNGTEQEHLANTWQTWTLLDPHATTELRRGTLDGWFVNILPDLNQNDPEVSRYLIQNSLWWIGRTGIDGIREDTVPYVPRPFWHDWAEAIHREYPRFRIVGEVFDEDPGMVSFFQRGRPGFDGVDTGLDSLFDFPLDAAIRHVFGHHASVTELSRVIAHDSLYPDAGHLVTFLGNHDMMRFRNDGDANMEDAARAFTFLFAVRGTPLIYYGDEIGMQGGNDPDNRRDFPGGWREDGRSAFEASGRTADENRLFEHIRRLASLRKECKALRGGSLVDLYVDEHAFAFARVAGGERIIAIFHEGTSAETVRIPVRAAGLKDDTQLVDALGTLPAATVVKGVLEVQLPARAAGIYRQQ